MAGHADAWKERERTKGVGAQWKNDPPLCIYSELGSRDTRLIFAAE